MAVETYPEEDQAVRRAKLFSVAEIDMITNAKAGLLATAKEFVTMMDASINWKSVLVIEKMAELNIEKRDIFTFTIAGGYPAHLLNGAPTNDIDIYFTLDSVRDFWKWLYQNSKNTEANRPLLHSIDNLIVSESEDDYGALKQRVVGGENVVITKNSISITSTLLSRKFQLIVGFSGKDEDIVEQFDMLHCKCFFKYTSFKSTELSPVGTLVISREIYDAIIQKKMIFSPDKQPTPNRVKKYWDRGYDFGCDYSFYSVPIRVVDDYQRKAFAMEAYVKKYRLEKEKNNVSRS